MRTMAKEIANMSASLDLFSKKLKKMDRNFEKQQDSEISYKLPVSTQDEMFEMDKLCLDDEFRRKLVRKTKKIK